MPEPPCRAARACAPRPSDSRRARRHSARPDGRGSPPRSCSRAGLRHGAHRLGRADPPGDFGIAHRLADRDFPERLPDALLEGRAAHVERQVEADPSGLRRSRPPWRREPRIRYRRRSVPPSGNGPAGRGRARRDRRRAGWRQLPFSLGATRIAPSEHWPMAKRISSLPPPARYCVGVMPSILVDFS